jgi:hypothetical protein
MGYRVWRMAGKRCFRVPHTSYVIHDTRRARASERGVTLLDTVVGSALLLVVFLGISATFRLSIDVVTNNKARAGAITLANEQLEYIRSLSYDAIGTEGGIPSGVISQSEALSHNGVSYTRRTTIQYADDPADGAGVADENAISADYKSARVEVSWTTRGNTRGVALVTRVEPPNGMETAVSGGTLSIIVVDSDNEPVSSASVSITNSSANPDIDIDTYTNANGQVTLVGATTTGTYNVSVTRAGYSTDATYTIPNPVRGPLSVAANQTTSATFQIDLLSSLSVLTRAWEDGSPMNGIFHLHGEKTVSSDPLTYKYDDTQGGASATTTISNLEWDTYVWSVASTTGYDLAASCPIRSMYIAPNTSTTTILYLAPHTAHSLPVAVRANATNQLLSGASVRLYGSGFDETYATDSCGQTFFGGLSAGTYSMTVTASGYTTFNASNIAVSGVMALYEVALD